MVFQDFLIGLLYSGLLLCGCNVLMFALWYWEIDGGGPEQRRESDHQAADFLFPQQMVGLDENWAPHFFDYLYVAFTGSTAFSPTDTMPLSHRAKFLMMVVMARSYLLVHWFSTSWKGLHVFRNAQHWLRAPVPFTNRVTNIEKARVDHFGGINPHCWA